MSHVSLMQLPIKLSHIICVCVCVCVYTNHFYLYFVFNFLYDPAVCPLISVQSPPLLTRSSCGVLLADGAPLSELSWPSSLAVVAVSFSGLFTFVFLMLACLCCKKGDIGFKVSSLLPPAGSGGEKQTVCMRKERGDWLWS